LIDFEWALEDLSEPWKSFLVLLLKGPRSFFFGLGAERRRRGVFRCASLLVCYLGTKFMLDENVSVVVVVMGLGKTFYIP